MKPIDQRAVERAERETGASVTAQEHVLNRGRGSQVARAMAGRHLVPTALVGIDDEYAGSGTP
ncbi:MAG: hypothetical protein ACOC7N_00100 [Chloroflexota bacterium]